MSDEPTGEVARIHDADGWMVASQTIRRWARGDAVEGPDLVAELKYWLGYYGGAPAPTPGETT